MQISSACIAAEFCSRITLCPSRSSIHTRISSNQWVTRDRRRNKISSIKMAIKIKKNCVKCGNFFLAEAYQKKLCLSCVAKNLELSKEKWRQLRTSRRLQKDQKIRPEFSRDPADKIIEPIKGRPCLQCDNIFSSTGASNRICNPCKRLTIYG